MIFSKTVKQPRLTLVELPPTYFGQINGPKVKDVYAGFKFPPRAAPLLHSILLKAGFKDVKTIDPNYNQTPGRLNLKNFQRIGHSDYLLLSAITRTIPQTRQLARWYKRANPSGTVIVGGPHVTFLPKEALEWADVVVRNEGDQTVVELIQKLIKDGAPEGVKGVSYRQNEIFIHATSRPPLTEKELSLLPQPFYEKPIRHGKGYLTISTSRGCPFKCNFCTVRLIYGTKYRRRSNISIIAELRQMMNKPQKFVFFTDDNFAGRRGETKELLRQMITLGLDQKSYLVQLSIHSAFDPELLKLLKKANVFAVFIGVESINEETLKSFNKKATAEKNKEAIRLFREAGLWVHGMMMVGGDGDTDESLEETLRWARFNFDSVQFFAPTPLPGTEFARQMDETSRIVTKKYYLYDAQHVVIRPKNFTPGELQEKIFDMYRRFYSRVNVVRTWRKSVRPFHKLGVDAYARSLIKSLWTESQTQKYLTFLRMMSPK